LPRLLLLAYLVLVATVALARVFSGHPTVADLALTPDALAAGRVWLLATSAVIVNGSVVPQLLALIATMVVAVRWLGARFTIVVMVVAHVGATLLAYGVLFIATGDADGAHNRTFDYGTSAVWLGLLGALLPGARRRPGGRLVVAAACATAIVGALFFPLMPALEHALAFALGAGVGALREARRSAGQSARSAASTASGPAAAA
jgi:hypothetical protein